MHPRVLRCCESLCTGRAFPRKVLGSGFETSRSDSSLRNTVFWHLTSLSRACTESLQRLGPASASCHSCSARRGAGEESEIERRGRFGRSGSALPGGARWKGTREEGIGLGVRFRLGGPVGKDGPR